MGASRMKQVCSGIARDKFLYVLALPGLLYFLIFKYVPMWGIIISFQNYSPYQGMSGSPWVGLEHFQRFFSNPDFFMLFRNTLAINILSLVLFFPLPITKDYKAKNVQLIYNEFGPYMKVDLELSNDSNKDNDNVIFLSSFVANSPADMLIVNAIHNNQILRLISISRTDVEEFIKNKIPEYDFIKKWRSQVVTNATDISVPNTPQATTTPSPTPSTPASGPFCGDIMANYARQMQEVVDIYNRNGSSDTIGLEQLLSKLKVGMNQALKKY